MSQIFFHYSDELHDTEEVPYTGADETLAAEMNYIRQTKHRRKLLRSDIEI